MCTNTPTPSSGSTRPPAWREPNLPVASHDEVSRQLRLLVDWRGDLVKARTATINRLLWRVHELEPGWAPKARLLDLAKHSQALQAHLPVRQAEVRHLW
jgi:transposase